MNNKIIGQKNRSLILNLIKNNPDHNYSVKELSKITGINSGSVRMHLYDLENRNQIVCTQNNHKKRAKLKLFKIASWEN